MLSVMSWKVQIIVSNFEGVQVRTKVFKSLKGRSLIPDWKDILVSMSLLRSWTHRCSRGDAETAALSVLQLPPECSAQVLAGLSKYRSAAKCLMSRCLFTVLFATALQTGLDSNRAVCFYSFYVFFFKSYEAHNNKLLAHRSCFAELLKIACVQLKVTCLPS